jgi:hypothetical protein
MLPGGHGARARFRTGAFRERFAVMSDSQLLQNVIPLDQFVLHDGHCIYAYRLASEHFRAVEAGMSRPRVHLWLGIVQFSIDIGNGKPSFSYEV